MIKNINLKFKGRKLHGIVTISITIIAGVLFLVWLNRGSQLQPIDAEQRIKLLLSRSVTQNYAQLFNENNTLDYDTGLKLQEELRGVNNLNINDIEIRKLIPDYVLRPHRPTFIVKADINEDQVSSPRYFWLSWSNIDRETSETAWLFSL